MNTHEKNHSDDVDVMDEYAKDEVYSKEEKIISPELLSLQNTLNYIQENRHLSKEKPQEYLETCEQAYKDVVGFILENGGEFIPDVNNIYNTFGRDGNIPLIVRRENPGNVLALTEGHDISLSFDPKVAGDKGDKYANCAIWPFGSDRVAGIRTAFSEGRGMAGPIVLMLGVKQNSHNNKIENIDASDLVRGDINREAVRIASGTLKKEDLKFVIIRIQRMYFPNENLTDKERKDDSQQIFRGFTF